MAIRTFAYIYIYMRERFVSNVFHVIGEKRAEALDPNNSNWFRIYRYTQQMADFFTDIFNFLPLGHLIDEKILVLFVFGSWPFM